MTNSTLESQAEAKVTRVVFAGDREVTDEFDGLLEKFALWKVLRACAWISRFVNNIRKHEEQRTNGPLRTDETERQTLFWVARAQKQREGKREI